MGTATAFYFLVGAMALGLVFSVARAQPGNGSPGSVAWTSCTVAVLAVVLGSTALLVRLGVFVETDAMPPPALLVFFPIVLSTVALGLSPWGRRLASGLPLWFLVGYQAFRIPVEWILHALYLEGRLPQRMTYAGWNFDILTGVSAVALAVWIRWGSPSKNWVTAWNAVGTVLLTVIVTTAILSMPFRFQVFTAPPSNTIVFTIPFVWLPTFLVPMAALGHVLVALKLRGVEEPAHGDGAAPPI